MTDRLPRIVFPVLTFVTGCATTPEPAATPDARRYLLHLPAAYESRSDWPMILFLHGAGERGDDLALVKREGLPRILETLPDFPFVVVSPQEEKGRLWTPDGLSGLLDEIVRGYRVDSRKIFVTGLSTGATTALELAIARPERIATVAAISPTRIPSDLCGMKDVSVWIFQNAADDRVPPARSKRLARELEACGGRGEVRLTFYQREGHDAWTETFRRSNLYEWFLEHPRAAP